MASSSHEAMHRIFQKEPGVFGRAFRALDLPFPEPTAVSIMPTDLTETTPLERRVDTLLRFDTENEGSTRRSSPNSPNRAWPTARLSRLGGNW
ncbi:hypothetical protein [Streptomyces aureoverticillatus]|uniref:hypothetical protein n=1 Tax=Streptomyces aureoverticillatus TaxID=66871 RepID=UPI00281284C3|nr:hypothetical protein [Streptomyces aureoverticillatus]